MSKAEIYYFSGTGNSLVVARDIAQKINAQLISITSQMNKEKITTDSDVIGIIFPVYYVGLTNIPLIVQKFVNKLDKISTKYIFAVYTYGGGAGNTHQILDDLIKVRGGHLASGFGVQMPQNAFMKPFEDKGKLYNKWRDKKLDFIYEKVRAEKEGHFDSDSLFNGMVVKILEKLMKLELLKPIFLNPMKSSAGLPKGSKLTIEEIIPLMDKSFRTDANCTGCSTCSNVCPVQNIKMVSDKPVWHHMCENCLACIKWCPQKAIHGYGESPQGYHHPEVELSDMINR